MIDFEKFFLGEVGIIVKSLEEAVGRVDKVYTYQTYAFDNQN